MKKETKDKYDDLLNKLESDSDESRITMKRESEFNKIFDIKSQSIIRPTLDAISEDLQKRELDCEIVELKRDRRPSGGLIYPSLTLKISPGDLAIRPFQDIPEVEICGNLETLRVQITGFIQSSVDRIDMKYNQSIDLKDVSTDSIEEMVVDALSRLL